MYCDLGILLQTFENLKKKLSIFPQSWLITVCFLRCCLLITTIFSSEFNLDTDIFKYTKCGSCSCVNTLHIQNLLRAIMFYEIGTHSGVPKGNFDHKLFEYLTQEQLDRLALVPPSWQSSGTHQYPTRRLRHLGCNGYCSPSEQTGHLEIILQLYQAAP